MLFLEVNDTSDVFGKIGKHVQNILKIIYLLELGFLVKKLYKSSNQLTL